MNADAVLLDLDGTLYVGDAPIAGAIDAVRELRALPVGIRFLTNTTRRSRSSLVQWLQQRGFDIEVHELFTAPVAAARYLESRGIDRIALYVNSATIEDFAAFTIDDAGPQAIVVGDLGRDWTFDTLNRAFRQLLDGATLVALQKNRFWKTEHGLDLDAGPFVTALEFAAGTSATVVGKPNSEFFLQAVASIGVAPHDALVVGDDIETDIAGAQRAGIRGIMVRTGKYHRDVVERAATAPDAVIDSIAELPALLTKDGA